MSVACLKDKSIGSFVIEQIIDLSKILNKQTIFDEVNIYGMSDKDGSATISLEYIGKSFPSSMYEEILEFMHEVKTFVIGLKKEVKEQESPSSVFFDGIVKLVYRFRIWNEGGVYEVNDRVIIEK